MKKVISLIIVGIMVFVLVACNTQNVSNETTDIQSDIVTTLEESIKYQSLEVFNLMEGIESNISETIPDSSKASAVKATDFAVRLFKASNESGKNTLISPLSVMAALSMTLNGAKGETASQMEKVLGMSTKDLNEFYLNYTNALVNGEKYKLSLANSIWFTADERFTVNRKFLQTNADYFKADAYKAPFIDSTLKRINEWVDKKTDGMIPEIMDDISEAAVMYLINALSFDAEWDQVYAISQVKDGTFSLEDGTEKVAKMMTSAGEWHLDDGLAKGFMKYYSRYKYAFVAMLPNKGVTVDQYISSMTGEKVQEMLSNVKDGAFLASLPKFEYDYSIDMANVLKNMGMYDAFDSDRADFSNLGTLETGNVYIERVIHKTSICVAEDGTRAGAATEIDIRAGGIPEIFEDIVFNRPFVYMIIDMKNNIPIFIGTLMDVGG